MKRTQRDKLLDLFHIRGQRGVTPLDALEYADCMRLAARVWDLRREGFDIRSETVPGKPYDRYWLVEHPTQMRWGVES
jgi:hypothetical protein